MSKSQLRSLLFGAALLSIGVSANAAIVDTIESPTGFFVPTDAEKYDSPYYRYKDGGASNWGWTHNAIGGTITDAVLQISAFDVDFLDGERDGIYAMDNGVETFLGYLVGATDDWAFTDFVLGANFFDDIAAGLEIFMKIDEDNVSNTWAVTLAKSVLQVNGRVQQNPNPGQVPEPASLALLGLGLAGLAASRRRKQA